MNTGLPAAESASLSKSGFLTSFAEMLRSLEGDAEGSYRALVGVLAVAPELADDVGFAQMRRDVVFAYGASLFQDAKRALDAGRHADAGARFARVHELLVGHIGFFDLDHEAVLTRARELSLEMLAVRSPKDIALSDRRLQEIRDLAATSSINDASKHAFMLIGQSVIYRDIAPYLAIVEKANALTRIGDRTFWLLGLGVPFWIAGYLYARRRAF